MKRTPLSLAVYRADHRTVAKLFSAGADPNIADHEGRTPLHVSASYDDMRCLKLLLEHGANAQAIEVWSRSVVHFACEYPSHDATVEILKLLITNGVDLTLPDRFRASGLHRCATTVNSNAIELLLENDGAVDLKDEWGKTPLVDGIKHNQVAAVDTLLKHGADHTLQFGPDWDYDLLHVVARYADRNMLTYLSEKAFVGTNPQSLTLQGESVRNIFENRLLSPNPEMKVRFDTLLDRVALDNAFSIYPGLLPSSSVEQAQ